MTRPGIESRSPGLLTNTLLTRPMSRYTTVTKVANFIYVALKISFGKYLVFFLVVRVTYVALKISFGKFFQQASANNKTSIKKTQLIPICHNDFIVLLCLLLITTKNKSIYPILSPRAGYNTRSIFKQSKANLNSVFLLLAWLLYQGLRTQSTVLFTHNRGGEKLMDSCLPQGH